MRIAAGHLLLWVAALAAFAAVLIAGPTVRAKPAPTPVDAGESLAASLAVLDPEVLAALEKHGLSLAEVVRPPNGVRPARNPDGVTLNSELFARGAFSVVGRTIVQDLATINADSLEPTAQAAPWARFNKDYITTKSNSTFQLIGVVNRMDRAFIVREARTHGGCGEIRLIYGLDYENPVLGEAGRTVSSRMPMTLNLVLAARRNGDAQTCAQLAQRWVSMGRMPGEGAEAYAARLTGPGGALRGLEMRLVDRVELNMQALRLGASGKTDFGTHAEYLLRVFGWDETTGAFLISRMENQVDRERLANPETLRQFQEFLMSDAALKDLDRGMLVIPHRFLANRAISVAPGGASRSANDPFEGFLPDDTAINDAIARRAATGEPFATLTSPAAFRMRLREHSCTGCHQTRAIAGFHFTGADRAGRLAANAVAVPASAQFFGDLPRRRAVVTAFARGRPPSFFRGFSARPDVIYSVDLRGTQLIGGWGAACYRPPAGGAPDPGFAGWGCNQGLKCVVTFETSRQPGIGACFSDGPARVGEPMQSGRVTSAVYGQDRYVRDPAFRPAPWEQRSDLVASHQEYDSGDKTGGFPGGMLRLSTCERLPGEATCGRVASSGWNDCLRAHRNDFYYCLRENTAPAGMRACDARNPCRDDYICTQQFELSGSVPGKGTCIPPYFMFQFRADNHPQL